ncbi:SHOCT domain-containing protein [candidate division KSB3 bacterium]|uniref:SHOCT domain-containing protein n=1 Tax=candidate division KSB3 bacterium TaxID=2044937 RepID=A0A9D5JXR3_9BACT|nr:SHOCT domain-containing protein [candidate division KSB3 bacterium]MBD3326045.1 SHOCT domain-containing protein [candidate division KSB3 bacterium]
MDYPGRMIGLGVLMVVVIAVLLYVIIRYSLRESERRDKETAYDILQKRYAKGELSQEEYERMKRDLGR